MAKKLRHDLVEAFGRTDPSPDEPCTPTKQGKSKLSSQMIAALEEWNLPIDRMIRLKDLRESGLVLSSTHLEGLRESGTLPKAKWVSANFCYWTPKQIAEMILKFGEERPPRERKPKSAPVPKDPPRRRAGEAAPENRVSDSS